MLSRRTIASIGSVAIAGAAVVVVPAGARPHANPKHLGLELGSCTQTHVSQSQDNLKFNARVTEKGSKGRHRPHAKKTANHPVSGASVTATLTGPYVTNGQVSGTTDATGTVSLTVMISGPGSYTLALSATKAGETPAKLTKTINISGPVNAPCSVS